MSNLLTAGRFARLRPVGLPGVLLWGTRDRVPDVDHLPDLRRLAPCATRHVEPGWGHVPMLDAPRAPVAVVARLARGVAA